MVLLRFHLVRGRVIAHCLIHLSMLIVACRTIIIRRSIELDCWHANTGATQAIAHISFLSILKWIFGCISRPQAFRLVRNVIYELIFSANAFASITAWTMSVSVEKRILFLLYRWRRRRWHRPYVAELFISRNYEWCLSRATSALPIAVHSLNSMSLRFHANLTARPAKSPMLRVCHYTADSRVESREDAYTHSASILFPLQFYCHFRQNKIFEDDVCNWVGTRSSRLAMPVVIYFAKKIKCTKRTMLHWNVWKITSPRTAAGTGIDWRRNGKMAIRAKVTSGNRLQALTEFYFLRKFACIPVFLVFFLYFSGNFRQFVNKYCNAFAIDKKRHFSFNFTAFITLECTV